VGRGGSGTIFFAGCNLSCVFCQNYDISQPAHTDRDWDTPPDRLADIMLRLQNVGCENINLVSPSHVVPQILAALVLAVDGGLRLPLVYNSGGYDALHTLRQLAGVVDIYMPDMKYSDERVAERLSGAGDYVERNRAAVREMHRQVGDLVIDQRGVARRGLLVRHLVLPDGLAGTAEVARFLAEKVSRDTYINLMEQYRPAHTALEWGAGPGGDSASLRAPRAEAPSCDAICRAPTGAEFRIALSDVLEAGLWRLDGYEGMGVPSPGSGLW
jgi:putative pyruvate formate lyase activating enzyme